MNEDYNYKRFKSSYYNLSKFPGPSAGENFVDIELHNTEGKAVQLSSCLDKVLVIETGSVTCPMYSKCVTKMEEIKTDYPNINFVLVYVREAPPGNKLGKHESLNEKIDISRKVKSIYKDSRNVLIDDIDGKFHKTYWLMPNLIYVISENGIVLFRGDWNSPEYLRSVLKSIKEQKIHTKEHFEPSKPNPLTAIKALLLGGRIALWDILKELPMLIRSHKKAKFAYESNSS